MKGRLHFHKAGQGGFVWTVHTSRRCIRARKVIIHGDAETEFRPDYKVNPKAFIALQISRMTMVKGVLEIWSKAN